jgi:hypothetical protein
MRFLITLSLLLAALTSAAAASEESNFASPDAWQRSAEIQSPGND